MLSAQLDLTPPPLLQVEDENDPARGAELALMARVKASDPRACEQLVREYSGRMTAVARRFMRQDADAADAVQDALISAIRRAESFEGTARLWTWLHRVTVNACLMRLRAQERHDAAGSIDALLPSFTSDGHYAGRVRRWRDDACDAAEHSELRDRVRGAIDRLPAAYRTVILLRDIEQYDTEQTARMLDTTPGNIKTRLHRARRALRTLLEPHFARDE